MHLKFTEDILPVTDFRNNAADILERLTKSGRPILLTQRGRATAVLLDVREYQKLCDRLEELERNATERPAPAAVSIPAPAVSAATAPPPSVPTGLEDDLMRELERWIEQET